MVNLTFQSFSSTSTVPPKALVNVLTLNKPSPFSTCPDVVKPCSKSFHRAFLGKVPGFVISITS